MKLWGTLFVIYAILVAGAARWIESSPMERLTAVHALPVGHRIVAADFHREPGMHRTLGPNSAERIVGRYVGPNAIPQDGEVNENTTQAEYAGVPAKGHITFVLPAASVVGLVDLDAGMTIDVCTVSVCVAGGKIVALPCGSDAAACLLVVEAPQAETAHAASVMSSIATTTPRPAIEVVRDEPSS